MKIITAITLSIMLFAPVQAAFAQDLKAEIAEAMATVEKVKSGELEGDKAYESLLKTESKLNKAVKENPDAWKAFDTRARVKMTYGQYAGAVRDFQAAVDAYRRSPPKFPDPAVAFSVSDKAEVQYERLGYLDPAIDSLQDGQKLLKELVVEIERIRGGKSGAAWDTLEGTIRDARERINRALLTAFLEHPSRKDEAVKAFDHAIEVLPDDYQVRMKFGELLVRESRATEAVEAYTFAMTLKPDAVRPHCRLGGVHRILMNGKLRLEDSKGAKSHFKLALESYDTCLEANPQNVDILLNVVTMCREIENSGKAGLYQGKLDKIWGN